MHQITAAALKSAALRALNICDIDVENTQGVMSRYSTARVVHDIPEYFVKAGDVVGLAWRRSFRQVDERKGGPLLHEYDIYALSAHGGRFQLLHTSLTDFRA